MTTHYGPIRDGRWYGTLCRRAAVRGGAIQMSTHLRCVDCPTCLKLHAALPVTPAK